MLTLDRVYAFSVTPQRGIDEADVAAPSGGSVRITNALRQVVDRAFEKVSATALTTVDFDFDGLRNNEVRDQVMTVAFGATQAPRTAASRLARRLSATMDNRSRSALLLVTIETDDPKRRVSMLLLPREDVIQLGGSNEELLLTLLNDAFSTGSGLRKVARMHGHNNKSQFLSAEVLDLQLMSGQKSVADFWIREFLKARPRLDSETGSRHLAVAIQRAFDAAPENDRDAAIAAIFKASSGRVAKTSLAKFADELPTELHEAYFRGLADGELRRTAFDVDRTIVKTILAQWMITTKDGVVIYAPADTIGKAVQVTQSGAKRTVKYSGTIDKERVVRGRRGAAK